MTLPALAQPPSGGTESVTVTGTRAHQVIKEFVQKFATPAHVSGKLTRWHKGICPITVGLRPEAEAYIEDHLRKMAAEVGAPVDNSKHCRPNIEIAFTTTPQALIDNVRKTHPQNLGYAGTRKQIDALARVARPIQAWYLTQTRDLHGNPQIDTGRHSGPGLEIACPPATCYFPDAVPVIIDNSLRSDGLSSEFFHVIIVVDPTKLADYPIGRIADYISLVALADVAVPQTCEPLTSLLDLLIPGCIGVPEGLSPSDLAFLHGLYRMDPKDNLFFQQQTIISQIERDTADKSQ